MKWTKGRFRPHFEALEDRLTPSVTNAIFTGGNLTVLSNNVGTTVTLTATAPNNWDLVSGSTVGHYSGVANINVRLGAGADTVNVDAGAFTSGTNLNINTGRGADTVNINSTGGAGILSGRVNVIEYGGGTANIGNTGAATLTGPVVVVGAAGVSTTLNIPAGTLGGTLTASNVHTVSITGTSSLNDVSVSNGA